MERRPRVLLIGLDGATWDLLDPWIEDGELPFLASLRKESAWGTLESTIPVLTGAALPALYTGQNPARTGVFHFVKPDGSLYSFKDIRAPALWEVLGTKGVRGLVVNVPTTYPPKRFNGVIVSGGAPGADSPYMSPRDYYILSRFHRDIDYKPVEHTREENRDNLSRIVKEQTDMVIQALGSDDFGFCLYWISKTDTIQHRHWKDEGVLLPFWKNVDLALQKLIERTGFTHVITVSDHGFEDVPTYDLNVNVFLNRNGYTRFRFGSLGKLLFGVTVPVAMKAVPFPVLEKIKRFLFNKSEPDAGVGGRRRVLDTFENVYPGIDYSRSKAYLTQAWGITINRNLPPDRRLSVRNDIIAKMKEWNIKGTVVVKEIYGKEEVFVGEYAHQMPDITFLTDERFLARPTVGFSVLSEATYKRAYRGSHYNARNGLILIKGEGIRKGRFSGASLLDVAPTILHIYGEGIPGNMDGKVLSQVFAENGPFDRKVKEEPGHMDELARRIGHVSKKLRDITGAGAIRR